MPALLETTVTDANGPVCRNVFSSILTGPGIADGTARFVSECLLWVDAVDKRAVASCSEA
jgi:hypothetical protein